mmetsp:Transcript_61667/g.191013  ORF Transcript_61667/g.191013 Transcript_61667/m.191013 type:complete len:348 (-) Transcript_61667:29-1072(-)
MQLQQQLNQRAALSLMKRQKEFIIVEVMVLGSDGDLMTKLKPVPHSAGERAGKHLLHLLRSGVGSPMPSRPRCAAAPTGSPEEGHGATRPARPPAAVARGARPAAGPAAPALGEWTVHNAARRGSRFAAADAARAERTLQWRVQQRGLQRLANFWAAARIRKAVLEWLRGRRERRLRGSLRLLARSAARAAIDGAYVRAAPPRQQETARAVRESDDQVLDEAIARARAERDAMAASLRPAVAALDRACKKFTGRCHGGHPLDTAVHPGEGFSCGICGDSIPLCSLAATCPFRCGMFGLCCLPGPLANVGIAMLRRCGFWSSENGGGSRAMYDRDRGPSRGGGEDPRP